MLAGWRILIQIGALSLEIGKLLIAFIAKEQCFAASPTKTNTS
jgi:hypothetical protein